MKAAGVVKDRSAGDILNKTQIYERSYEIARDFSINTGKGIREIDGVATFEELVKKSLSIIFC